MVYGAGFHGFGLCLIANVKKLPFNIYHSQTFVFMRLSFLVMTAASFGPPYDEIQSRFPGTVFSPGTLLFWSAAEDMILPSNVCVYHHI